MKLFMLLLVRDLMLVNKHLQNLTFSTFGACFCAKN